MVFPGLFIDQRKHRVSPETSIVLSDYKMSCSTSSTSSSTPTIHADNVGSKPNSKLPIILDIETSDPDDVLMLILACAHPRVDLKAVNVTPGTREQLALVRAVLNHVFPPHNTTIAVGAFDTTHGDPAFHNGKHTSCVSGFHYKAFEHIGFKADSRFVGEATEGHDVLLAHWTNETTLVSGAPLKNLSKFLKLQGEQQHERRLRWICQGGFAGSNVVPLEKQLTKFKNLEFCDTYNLCGALKSATLALESALLRDATFVSKNVCHGVVFDSKRLNQLRVVVTSMEPHAVDSPRFRSLSLALHAMSMYLQKRADGKKFHDPLALCCALDSSLFELVPVKLVHRKGAGFGCELDGDKPHRISIACDQEKCFELLFEI